MIALRAIPGVVEVGLEDLAVGRRDPRPVEVLVAADRVAVIQSGRLVALDTPARLVASGGVDAVISFDLPEAREVRLAVYALDGSLVRMLASGELPAGTHDIVWDGRDDRGRQVSSGVYLGVLRTGEEVRTAKLIVLK